MPFNTYKQLINTAERETYGKAGEYEDGGDDDTNDVPITQWYI